MKRLTAGLFVLLVAVTCVAAVQAAPQEKQEAQLLHATVVENGIWVEDAGKAQAKAKLIAEAGFNSVRIFVPYSPTQAEIKNDALRLCNAATAARDNGLALIVTPYGVYPGHKPGFVPKGATQVTWFIKTLRDHMFWLFGANGCTKDVREFTVEIMNELNSETFCDAQRDSEGKWIAPARYTRTLARVYPALHDLGDEMGVKVTVIAGALAGNHDTLGFIAKMGETIRKRGIQTPLFDWFSTHPYPASSSESPETRHSDGKVIGIADYDQLEKALKGAFGFVPPIFYSEAGWESEIPKSQRHLYQGKTAPSVKPVSEAVQALYYGRAFQLAAEQPQVVGLALFHLFDDSQLKDWQSGLYYADDGDDATPPVAKSSLPAVRQAISRVLGAPDAPTDNPPQPAPAGWGVLIFSIFFGPF